MIRVIIEALYFELVEKSDNEMELLNENIDLIMIFHQVSKKSMELFYDYRFLLRDWYFIFRQSNQIKSHYGNLYLMRKGQFAGIVEAMIKQKILKQEEFPKEYDRFFERMNIISDNWINDFETVNDGIKNPLVYYQNLIFEMIYPYLTKKGKKRYESMYKYLCKPSDV